jgi:catechol 2,3-dioxygenase-like lactoylglutathione lyase family enzyme
MIDHTGLVVSNFHRSKSFYAAALAPLGLNLVAELSASVTGHAEAAGFSESPDLEFWISEGRPHRPAAHIAFHVDSPDRVDHFYAAAIKAGGRDNGPPGVRAYYMPNYYSAFVLDPDGHQIEAFCHT